MRYIRLALFSAFALAFLSLPFRTGAQLIQTVVGNGTAAFSGDGISATSAELNHAFGVTLDANGNLYIADTDNQRVRVVNMGVTTITIAGVSIPAGDIATIAGNGTAGYVGDGSAATSAELYNPSGVAVDSAGNIYIADLYNFRVRKVNTSGIISTVVGNGNQNFGGDNGLATNASLDPYAIAVDHNGVLFIADTYNQRIRVVNTLTRSITIAGVTIQPNYIATVAGDGNFNFSGNGVPALSAEFDDPYSIAVDGSSNIYICDTYNRVMRVVNTGTSPITVAQVTIQPGYIATVAGDGNYGFRGDGFSALVAEFADPDGIGVDTAGNIYVSDLENERIRMINNATGLISTIAGMGGAGTVGYGYNGDGIPATSALLAYPRTVTIDGRGNVYFSDEPNLRIREITVNPGAPTLSSRASTAFTVGVSGTFTVTTGALPAATLSESGTLPGGITFVNNGNGTATLSGIPAAGTAGSYNLLFTAGNGVLPNATQNFTLTIYAAGGGPTATLVSEDTSTEGAWQSKYGKDGYSIAGVSSQVIPSYAAFAQQNLVVSPYTWVATTNDPRALQIPGSSTGTASTWYNSAAFDFDINLTDGNPHQIALYMLDWDYHGRAETIQVLDANSGATLDTETVSNFGTGIYLVWNLTGHVQIVITATAGPNAVVAGVFFGGGGNLSTSVLSITKSHTGTFAQGQQNATYTLRISNLTGAATTNGAVTVTETVPSGLSLVSMAGSNWSCPANTNSCTRSDPLSGGTSYQPITVTVNVGASATSPQVNQASVSGGGSTTATAASDSTTITGTGGAAVATFNLQDSKTQGNWQGVYGADGYSLANVTPQSIPAYATFAVTNQTNYTWTASSSDPRALQVPGGSSRIAAAWYNFSSFSFDVNFIDGNSHQFAMYALDWDNGGRAETIQIRDEVTNTLLDSRTISNFGNGIYLVWNVSGHVTITVTTTGGANSVISGVFFGGSSGGTQSTPTIAWASPSPITYGTSLSSTQLNATAAFDGLPLPGTFVYTPAAGTILTAGIQTLSVTFTPTDTTDYKSVTATVSITVNQATPTISWPTPSPITYGTALSGTQLNATATFNSTAVLGTFGYSPSTGAVLNTGSQTLSVTFTPADLTDFTTATGTVIIQVNQPVASSQVAYVIADSTTKGNWQGVYGADGYSIANSSENIPAYATLAVQNQTNYTWTTTTTDPRALQTGTGSTRIASAWYAGSTFDFDVNFVDGNAHQFALYALDWDGGGRAEKIDIRDASTNTLLDTRTISNFSNGLYLVWNISGHVKVNVTLVSGANAVISGVFFGSAPSSTQSTPVITWAAPAAITYGTALSGTQLNATASFNGSSVAGSFVYSPAAGVVLTAGSQTLGVTFTPTDTADYKTVTSSVSLTVNQATPTIAWATPAPITYGTALSGTQLNASASFNGSSVPGTFVYSPAAGAVLTAGSQTLSVTFTPTDATDFKSAGASVTLVVNPSSSGSPTVTFVVSDSSTQGNWQGSYGADGFSLANSTQSLPSYASFTPQGQSNYTWSSSTSDPRALQFPGGSRIASAWYGSAFSFDVNFTDGNSHLFAFYALDWDNGGRAETIQVLDAATNAILDTRTISNFNNGLYLVWNISGHVKFTVSLLSGSNAVLNGAFFGGNGAVSVAVNPQSINLIANQSQSFTATVTGSTNQNVSWSVSPNVGTITPTGASTATYTAPSSIASAQTVTVTATSAAAPKSGSASVSLLAGSSAANFTGFDNTTQGSWKGVYGNDGYSLANSSQQSIPAYAVFSIPNAQLFTWSASTTDPRALQNASGSGRFAPTWYNSPSFYFDVNLTDGNSHKIELYAMDWDNAGRAETIQVLDAATNTVLDTRTISNFSNGLYLLWTISGHVKIQVSLVSGANSVSSALFFR